jgi:ubiquinone/menaquinone biosynthesis C-methylase UbiE
MERLASIPWVSVRLGDAQAPAFPDGSFDVVTAGLVLFFLPDPRAALTAYRKLLRPSGRLAFTCFAAHDPRYPEALRVWRGTPKARRRRAATTTFTFHTQLRIVLAS